jgi:N-glycosylase/DNA lyase
MSSGMYTHKVHVARFNLKHTFESAQPLTFHGDYDPISNSLLYVANSRLINVGFYGNGKEGDLVAMGNDPSFIPYEIQRRFRTEDNMAKIYKKIGTDATIKSAINNYDGMRLTLNDQWETTLCFIISQYNNVPRIRKIVKSIIEKYGDPIKNDSGRVVARSFPSSAILANATIKDLMECGAGFRAKYIKEAAEYCTNNLDLYKLNASKYEKLRDSLLEIKGVGDKVADCIILMGYGNLEAFPIDVWVKRTMENMYFKGKKKKAAQIQEFAHKRWGGYAGYAQQYIFHSGRQNG